jgi:ribosome-interacting GTPase 1
MPINADQAYYAAEKHYHEANTIDEKIARLEEMIRCAPKHKGAENLLAQLRLQLSKLKKEKQKQKKKAKRGFGIEKEGAGQACLLGFANSGKTHLLKALTGVGEPSEIPYSTTRPQVGMMLFEDVWIQIVEIPPSMEPRYLSVANSADVNLCLIDSSKPEQMDEMKKIIEAHKIRKVIFVFNQRENSAANSVNFSVSAKTGEGIPELKKRIWDSLGVIRVYTKSFGKSHEKKPVILKKNATVMDIARNIHKDMYKFFKFARVWGSTKYPGTKVGMDYHLRDKDIVEIRME